MTILSSEAQVYGELTGLAQAAIDGRDVSLIACGPPGAGMSFTLCLDRQHSKVWLSPKDGGYTVGIPLNTVKKQNKSFG